MYLSLFYLSTILNPIYEDDCENDPPLSIQEDDLLLGELLFEEEEDEDDQTI